MTAFGGSEPLVGEIVAVRTFRVEDTGLLLPLFADGAWYRGTNVAVCASPARSALRRPHEVAATDCECGFYAYGGLEQTRRHWQARYVLAVVSCWGRVIAGSRGIRATHARIEAIWLAPTASPDLRRRVAQAYPDATVYADRAQMLSAHPLSPLPTYANRVRRRPSALVGAQTLFTAAVLALGALPSGWRVGALWYAWFAVTLAVIGALAVVLGNRAGRSPSAIAVLAVALAWLLAPVAGWASVVGWMLRAPVVLLVIGAVQSVVTRSRPGYFPAVRTGGRRVRPTIAR